MIRNLLIKLLFSGCEHLGLLQHDAWYDAPASTEGAWREEEIGCVEHFWVYGNYCSHFTYYQAFVLE